MSSNPHTEQQGQIDYRARFPLLHKHRERRIIWHVGHLDKF